MKWTLRSLFYTLILALFISGFATAMAHEKAYSCVLESSHDSRLEISDVSDGPDIFSIRIGIVADDGHITLAAVIRSQIVSALIVRLPESRAPPPFFLNLPRNS